VWGWIWVHFLAKTLYEFEKCVAIEGANLYAAVDYAIERKGW